MHTAPPPAVEKALREAADPPRCLRLAIYYLSWRDEPYSILALWIVDGLPGLYEALCEKLSKTYLGFLREQEL